LENILMPTITPSPCDITLDGVRIHYEVSGLADGRPAILIHGWVSDHRAWDSLLPLLAGEHRCYALDLPGFGQSDKPLDRQYTVEEQAATLIALMDALGLDGFALMGHSMGGMIALAAAAQLGRRVERLVVIGSVVEGRMTPYAYRFKRWVDLSRLDWLVPPTLWTVKTLNLIPPLSARGWYYDRSRVSPARHEASMDAMFPGDNWHAIRQAAHSFTHTNIIPQAQAITTPTLIVVGLHDNTIPPDQSRTLRAALPDADLLELPECGHWPMDEYPAAVHAALSQFLNHREKG
jgi:pimeloyl-ACP methyl ester carboxylesterase